MFFLTNYFLFKINKYFTANYNLDLIYDDDVKLFGKEGKSPGLAVEEFDWSWFYDEAEIAIIEWRLVQAL